MQLGALGRPAVGHDLHDVVGARHVERADGHGDEGERHDERPGHIAEGLPRRAAVDARRLDRLARHGEQAGQDEDREHRGRRPDLGDQDGDEGEVAVDQPGDRAVGEAERLQRVVHQADIVVEHELELEADQDRREHHREHHERAQHALAARRLLDQQRQAEAEQHFEVERDGQQQHGAAEGDPEIPIGEDVHSSCAMPMKTQKVSGLVSRNGVKLE